MPYLQKEEYNTQGVCTTPSQPLTPAPGALGAPPQQSIPAGVTLQPLEKLGAGWLTTSLQQGQTSNDALLVSLVITASLRPTGPGCMGRSSPWGRGVCRGSIMQGAAAKETCDQAAGGGSS